MNLMSVDYQTMIVCPRYIKQSHFNHGARWQSNALKIRYSSGYCRAHLSLPSFLHRNFLIVNSYHTGAAYGGDHIAESGNEIHRSQAIDRQIPFLVKDGDK